ncbi:MAG: hypothetical protein M1814_006755 [Vezdaea aestivalis]|nr:MAG: hypothetical protein M1814_006755 [Vezdaea aestivalis]
MPPTGVPPPLPPSVETAYRNKCSDLYKRMSEVTASNDEYRMRKLRLKRGILKLRLERAFLLEQLDKRTSRNVEDSDGSDSGVATPQEKPLRIKRGHRRPSLMNQIRSNSAAAAPGLDAVKAGHVAKSGDGQDSVRDEGSRIDQEEDRIMGEAEDDGDVEMGDGEVDGEMDVNTPAEGDGEE